MAHLLRGKQAGIQNDLSAGLAPELCMLDEINRYGINSQVSAIAYDPVQGLLAVGTNDTQFGEGQIYVFGQKRVSVVLSLPRKASVRTLQFCADKLLSLDSRNEFCIFGLEAKKLIASYSPPGTVTAICCDPSLDYVLLGMQTGEIVAYDLDRERLAALRLPAFWKERDPRAKITPIVALHFHPRDIGSLLIGYAEGAVIFSFKQNKAIRFFQYEVARGAPGGDSDPAAMGVIRHPRLVQAAWHPTGTFVLTGHEDGSLVFWDHIRDGRIVMARTLTETNVDKPGSAGINPASTFAMKEPLFKIAWCAKQDPDDTGLLIAGGASTTSPTKGLTFLEFGRTPIYNTSSWPVLSQHFESPQRQRVLPTPPNAEVVDFCMIPRTSPYYAGAHDPVAILAILSSGEVISLSFPSGHPISPTNQLHASLTFVHPFTTALSLSAVERSKWLGMTEKRSAGPPMLRGGLEASRPMKRFEDRNIVQTAHADGTVRLWDAGHGDEIENDALLEVDVSRAVGRPEGAQITQMSFSGASHEFVAGTRTGEVVIFRWGHNRNAGRDSGASHENKPGGLADISSRADPNVIDGLLPLTLLDLQSGPITAVKISDVGFVAAASEGGHVAVIDLRGPAVIYNAHVTDFVRPERHGSFRGRGASQSRPDWPVRLEFSVMTLEGENYSSILLHVGTTLGHVATLKLLPDPSGRYTVQFAGVVSFDDRIISISPFHADTGYPAFASQQAVANLRHGTRINGVLLVVTQSGARIFKPATTKGAHKTWDNVFCHSAMLCRFEDKAYALVGLFGDGCVKAYSIPALKEISSIRVSQIFDIKRAHEAIISTSGDVLGWTGPSEIALINIWGTGLILNRSKDTLFNPTIIYPARPTISNLQWVSGTQYVTPADMDILIGGPDRPPSKRMIAQARAEEAAARQAGRAGTPSGSGSSAGQQDEGYWAYMTRTMQERTEKLTFMSDSTNKLEEASASWAEEVGNFVGRQKKNLVKGAIKSKFGI